MSKDSSLIRLDELIRRICTIYSECSNEWEQYAKEHDFKLFNQRKVKVIHTLQNSEYWDTILAYNDFLSISEYNRKFKDFLYEYSINTRVKNPHSIEDKREDYISFRPEKGEVSISKCFNDLFGIRIILDEELLLEDIESICSKYIDVVNIEKKDVPPNRSGHGYKAIHLYFSKGNFCFRWELQIWSSSNEKSNMQSHKYHRYKYAIWESEEKNR